MRLVGPRRAREENIGVLRWSLEVGEGVSRLLLGGRKRGGEVIGQGLRGGGG